MKLGNFLKGFPFFIYFYKKEFEMDILFPAFVSLYTDENNNSCIYYFRGLNSDGNWIYQPFNDEQLSDTEKTETKDGAIICKFNNKITKLQCNLVSNYTEIPNKKININNK